MSVVGVDGCGDGWVGIRLEDGGEWKTLVFNDIGLLWAAWRDAKRILVDVPIGLPRKGMAARRCDTLARAILRWPRMNSVFAVPCREACHAGSRIKASAVNVAQLGVGVNVFTWTIVEKINEMDDFLAGSPDARQVIREVHPEFCFWGLAGGQPMRFKKTTLEGEEERRRVLSDTDPRADRILQDAQKLLNKAQVERHDILDALSAALTAQARAGELRAIPTQPQWDSRGLRMEMVYRLRR